MLLVVKLQNQLERFSNNYVFDFKVITGLVVSLEGIENWGDIVLCFDRNWKVGKAY